MSFFGDPLQRIVMQVEGREDVARLKKEIEDYESELRKLRAELDAGHISQAQFDADARHMATGIQGAASEVRRIEADTRNMGRGVLQTSYAFQDFTSQIRNGVLPAFASIQNNIPQIVMGFGGTAGIAGAIGGVTVAIGALIAIGPHLVTFFNWVTGQASITADSIEGLKERIKELSKEKLTLYVDMKELEDAKEKLKAFEEGLRTAQSAMKDMSEDQQKSAAAVGKAFAEAPGGAKAAQEPIVAQFQKEIELRDPVIVQYQKDLGELKRLQETYKNFITTGKATFTALDKFGQEVQVEDKDFAGGKKTLEAITALEAKVKKETDEVKKRGLEIPKLALEQYGKLLDDVKAGVAGAMDKLIERVTAASAEGKMKRTIKEAGKPDVEVDIGPLIEGRLEEARPERIKQVRMQKEAADEAKKEWNEMVAWQDDMMEGIDKEVRQDARALADARNKRGRDRINLAEEIKKDADKQAKEDLKNAEAVAQAGLGKDVGVQKAIQDALGRGMDVQDIVNRMQPAIPRIIKAGVPPELAQDVLKSIVEKLVQDMRLRIAANIPELRLPGAVGIPQPRPVMRRPPLPKEPKARAVEFQKRKREDEAIRNAEVAKRKADNEARIKRDREAKMLPKARAALRPKIVVDEQAEALKKLQKEDAEKAADKAKDAQEKALEPLKAQQKAQMANLKAAQAGEEEPLDLMQRDIDMGMVPDQQQAQREVARQRRIMKNRQQMEIDQLEKEQAQELLNPPQMPKAKGVADVGGQFQKFAEETQMVIAFQDMHLNAIAQAFGPAAMNMAQMRVRMQANAVQSFPYIGEGV